MGIIKISALSEGIVGKLGIWDLAENSSALLQGFRFSEKEQADFSKISNEKRKCEFLAVRLLLDKMLDGKKQLQYAQSGKPFLEEDLYISISHSSDLAAVLLSKQPAGIDVESLHRKTDKIAPRYLSDKELEDISSTPNPDFTRIVYWCAKEALFKCTPLEGIDFKRQILIKPFLPGFGNGIFEGQLAKNNRLVNFVFHYFIVNNNVLVYCTEKENT